MNKDANILALAIKERKAIEVARKIVEENEKIELKKRVEQAETLIQLMVEEFKKKGHINFLGSVEKTLRDDIFPVLLKHIEIGE